jgi:hypothetical protein
MGARDSGHGVLLVFLQLVDVATPFGKILELVWTPKFLAKRADKDSHAAHICDF